MVSSYWVMILTFFAINAISGLGLYITLQTGQLALCFGAMMAVGEYASAVMSVKFGMPFPIALLAAAVAPTMVGALLAEINLRIKGIYLAVSTFAFGEVMVVIAMNNSYLGGAQGIGGIPLKTTSLLVFVILGILIYFFIRLDKSRIGMALRATGDDELTASAMGINVARMKVLSFALGSLIAGLSGGLWAHYVGTVEALDYGFFHSLNILFYNIIGGTEVVWGPIVGAAVLTFFPEFFRFATWARYMFYGILIVIILIVRPAGILTRKYGGRSLVSRVLYR